MTITLNTWPSARNDATEDRWSSMMRRLFTNGVHANTADTNEFRPYGDSTGMQAKTGTGAVNIQGFYAESSVFQTLSVAAAHSTLNRLDLLVLRLDHTSPVTIYLDILTGSPSSSPALPALTVNSSIVEIPVGVVTVGHGVSTIRDVDVTDARVYCMVQNPGPAGVPMPFLGSVAPVGHLLLAGQTGLSALQYPVLAAVMGVTSGTFSLPNWSGRIPVGVDSAHPLGATGGSLTHTNLVSEMASHSHDPVKAGSPYEIVISSPNPETHYIMANAQIPGGTGNTNATYSPLGVEGGSTPFNIEQPWVACNWIVKAY